jgi:hypothetical protein
MMVRIIGTKPREAKRNSYAFTADLHRSSRTKLPENPRFDILGLLAQITGGVFAGDAA